MKILSKIKRFLFGRNVPAPAPGTPVKAPRKRIKPKLIFPHVPHGGDRVGRGNVIQNYTGRKLYLEQVDTTYDDGYDKGGAYWGLPSPTAGRVWCAWCCVTSVIDGEPDEAVRIFVWAISREGAKENVRFLLPTASFYR